MVIRREGEEERSKKRLRRIELYRFRIGFGVAVPAALLYHVEINLNLQSLISNPQF